MSNSYQGYGQGFDGLRRSFAGGNSDVKVTKFIEIAKELIASITPSKEEGQYEIFSINDSEISYPVIVLTAIHKDDDGSKFAYYAPLIIASTSRRGEQRENVDFKDYRGILTYPITADTIYQDADANTFLTNKILAEINSISGIKDANDIMYVEGFISPNVQGVDDLCDQKQFVQEQLYYIANALYSTHLNALRNSGALTEEQLKSSFFTSDLLVGIPSYTVLYSVGPVYGPSREPIRRDLSVCLSNNQQNKGTSHFIQDRSRDIVEVHGYIDTVWLENSNMPRHENVYKQRYRQSQDHVDELKPTYCALSIMTHFSNRAADGVPPTLEVVLAGILTWTITSEADVWQRCYDPASIGQDTPYNLAGTLIETNIPVPEGEEIIFKDYMDTAWEEHPAFAIDVVVNGPLYWILKPLVEDDVATFMASCDTFFNGNFSKYWDVKRSLSAQVYTLQGGTYINGKDVADVREVDDYLYALNYIGNNPDRRDFDELFDSLQDNWNGYSEEERLAIRYQTVDGLARSTFKPTSTIKRVILSPDLIDALVAAAVDCGIKINPTNRQSKSDNSTRRGLGLGQYTYRDNSKLFGARSRYTR